LAPDDLRVSGACDCHVHIVGALGEFPQIATRSYTAGVASLDSLRALAKPAGVSRFVLVQPSFYGTDNACLLEALSALGDHGRGVAMIDPTVVTADLLDQYARHGVCGLRANLYSKSLARGSESTEDLLQAAIESAPRAGWHVEIIAPASTLLSAARVIESSAIPVVIDHYGLPDNFAPQSFEGQRLLELIRLPHVWVKLSAPYRMLDDPLATKPLADWLAAFAHAAPDRCVWGSDWPHTPLSRHQQGAAFAVPYRKIEYSKLFRDFIQALGDATANERILVTNPARLYGFPSGSRENPH
jgi:predicted TIM-barrel fold metal-dependent hydrolase